jgi:hypothetical protein
MRSCARAKTLLRHGTLKQSLALGGKFAIGANLAGTHLGVGEDTLPGSGKAVKLDLTGAQDALAYLLWAFRPGSAAKFFVVHGRNVNMNVYAIKQRTV